MKNSKEITYKRYKIVLIVAVIAVILLPISNGSVLLYEVNRYNVLDNRYDQLADQHDSLQSQHTSLQSEHNSLENNYNSLNNKHNNLKSDYSNLQSDYKSLESQYNTLYEGYQSLDEDYEFYKNSIEFRYGDGSDCQLFVTPDDYSVISKTRNVLGSDYDGDLTWDDMRTINDWVEGNIKYNYDTYIGYRRNCYQYPSETLDIMRGDCEDHSVLMVSMCKAEEDVGWIWCASVNFYQGGKWQSHVCVFVAVADDKLYIFEPTGSGATGGWHSSYAKSEYDALEEYRQYWSASSMEVSKIFSDKAYFTFNTNQQFFDFF